MKKVALLTICALGTMMPLTGCSLIEKIANNTGEQINNAVDNYTSYTFTNFQDEIAKRNIPDHEYKTAVMLYERKQGSEESSKTVNYNWENMRLVLPEDDTSAGTNSIWTCTLSTGYLKSFLNEISATKTSSKYKYYINSSSYRMTYKLDNSKEEYKIEAEYFFNQELCLTSGTLKYTNRADLSLTTYTFTLTHNK